MSAPGGANQFHRSDLLERMVRSSGVEPGPTLEALMDGPGVSADLKTDQICRFKNRVWGDGGKAPSEGCSDGGAGLDWMGGQGGLIWSLVR